MGVSPPGGEKMESCPAVHAKLRINDVQRTKLYTKNRFYEIVRSHGYDYISLQVDCETLKHLDTTKVIINEDNELKIFDAIYVSNDVVYLDTAGINTDIITKLIDYIIDNDKKVFDIETLQYLYNLQDEALEKIKNQLDEEKREEEERRKRIEEEKRAREILKDEIDEYERKISSLNEQIEYFKEQLDKKRNKIEEQKKIIEMYVKFIKTKNLTDEFVQFIKEHDLEKYVEELKQKYYFT